MMTKIFTREKDNIMKLEVDLNENQVEDLISSINKNKFIRIQTEFTVLCLNTDTITRIVIDKGCCI